MFLLPLNDDQSDYLWRSHLHSLAAFPNIRDNPSGLYALPSTNEQSEKLSVEEYS
jgi:hypothetical protein